MPDNHYLHPRLAAVYDATEAPYALEEAFYLGLAGEPPKRVLDIGCGVGTLVHGFRALGHQATGVDPAPAMLDVARAKPGGEAVTWVHGRAQDVRLEEAFDLIIMTGHAFQVLLTDADLTSALANMAQYLAPSGRLAFETRNPALKWEGLWAARPAKTWDVKGVSVTIESEVHGRGPAMGLPALELPAIGDRDMIRFEHIYTFPDEVLRSESILRFTEKAPLEEMLREAGLQVEALYGNWDKSAFDPETSPEMIFVATRVP